MRRHRLPLIAVLLCAPPAVLAAQDSTAAGHYTAEQAERGAAVFRRICGQCHVVQQFSGTPFRVTWGGRPAFELFEQIRTTMPNDNPGSLPRQQYADVVAYVMKLNGVAPSSAELPVDPDVLRRVLIPSATEPRNR